MTAEPETLSGVEMRRRIDEIHDNVRILTFLMPSGSFMAQPGGGTKYPHHIIAQTRKAAEAVHRKDPLQEGYTLTFYDEDGNDAYCLAKVQDGEILVTAQTFGLINETDS